MPDDPIAEVRKALAETTCRLRILSGRQRRVEREIRGIVRRIDVVVLWFGVALVGLVTGLVSYLATVKK